MSPGEKDSISSFRNLLLFIKSPYHYESFSLCSCLQYKNFNVIKLFLILFTFRVNIFYTFILDYISILGYETSDTEGCRAFHMFCSSTSETVRASRFSESPEDVCCLKGSVVYSAPFTWPTSTLNF